ncbi:hypothetical protein [Wolbachia endosymbiont (group A) of Gymnosoma rotundatum]|nr:hypothetical protein [Wolbachia endosymbiont (group A) of Gymnosoma rotundatum]
MTNTLRAPLHHYKLCQSKHDKGNKRCCKISVACNINEQEKYSK